MKTVLRPLKHATEITEAIKLDQMDKWKLKR